MPTSLEQIGWLVTKNANTFTDEKDKEPHVWINYKYTMLMYIINDQATILPSSI